MQASFALALGQAICVRNPEGGTMHSPKDLPSLAPSSKKHPHKNKSDLAEMRAGMKTYTGRKLAPSEPTEPLEISPFI